MATFTMNQYQKVWRKRAIQIKKNGIKSAFQAARYMVAQAKSRAPKKTGETMEGIYKKKSKDGYTVISDVNTEFKQNMWANQTAPFRTLFWKHGNRKFKIKPGTKGLYGVSPTHFKWTGHPRFFHFATLATREMYPKIARKNNLEALKVTV